MMYHVSRKETREWITYLAHKEGYNNVFPNHTPIICWDSEKEELIATVVDVLESCKLTPGEDVMLASVGLLNKLWLSAQKELEKDTWIRRNFITTP